MNTVKSNSKAQHALADCYANFIDKLQSSIRKADDDIAILSDLVSTFNMSSPAPTFNCVTGGTTKGRGSGENNSI